MFECHSVWNHNKFTSFFWHTTSNTCFVFCSCSVTKTHQGRQLSPEHSLFHSWSVRCQVQSNSVDLSSVFWCKHVFRLPVKWKKASLLISQSLTVVFHPERDGLERSCVPEDILRLFYVWEVWRWLCLARPLSIYQHRQKSMQLSFMNVVKLS